MIAVCDFIAEHEDELGFFENDTFVAFARLAVTLYSSFVFVLFFFAFFFYRN